MKYETKKKEKKRPSSRRSYVRDMHARHNIMK
jgi:hypothetical protein